MARNSATSSVPSSQSKQPMLQAEEEVQADLDQAICLSMGNGQDQQIHKGEDYTKVTFKP